MNYLKNKFFWISLVVVVLGFTALNLIVYFIPMTIKIIFLIGALIAAFSVWAMFLADVLIDKFKSDDSYDPDSYNLDNDAS